MSGPRNPDQGSADCSSTVNWAYKNVVNKNIGGNTDAILRSGLLSTIDLADLPEAGGGDNSKGPNAEKLMPGDVVLFSRPGKGYSSGRPYSVGHVEMYMGDGKTIGHGGPGVGPGGPQKQGLNRLLSYLKDRLTILEQFIINRMQ